MRSQSPAIVRIMRASEFIISRRSCVASFLGGPPCLTLSRLFPLLPSLPPIPSPSILSAVSLSLFLDHTPSIVSHETSHWPQNTSVPRFNEAPRPFTDVGGSCSGESQWLAGCLTRLDTHSSVGTNSLTLLGLLQPGVPAGWEKRFWG